MSLLQKSPIKENILQKRPIILSRLLTVATPQDLPQLETSIRDFQIETFQCTCSAIDELSKFKERFGNDNKAHAIVGLFLAQKPLNTGLFVWKNTRTLGGH